jgi:hypothetical protein
MKLIVLVISIFILNSTFGQKQFYSIAALGTKYSFEQLNESMKKADWCGYFNSNSRFKINFDDGAIVELLSGKEEFDIKNQLDQNCFQTELMEDKGMFKIHESGILVKMLSARNTTKN